MIFMGKKHLEHGFDERGEDWVEQGLEYLAEKRCPFCGQGTETVPLVLAYSGFFNKAYKDLKGKIQEMNRNVQERLSEQNLAAMHGTIESNALLREFWSDHVSLDAVDLAFGDIERNYRRLRELLDIALLQKHSAPAEEIAWSSELQESASTFKDSTRRIQPTFRR